MTKHFRCEKRDCGCEGVHFREQWTQGSIYRPGEAVPFQGSSYVAIHLNQNDPPPSANWALIAGKGDPGAAGPPGGAGPQGPAGIAGASEVFTALTGEGGNMGTGGLDVATVAVPPGSYLVMGTVCFGNFDSDPQGWTFELRLNGAPFSKMLGTAPGIGGGFLSVGDAPALNQNMSILGTCTTPESASITLRGFGFSVSYDQRTVQLVAVKVGVITKSR